MKLKSASYIMYTFYICENPTLALY